MTKKNPPYAKALGHRIRSGAGPSNGIWIYCGTEAWSQSKRTLEQRPERGVLCLPPHNDPMVYDWSICDGFDVLVVHTGGVDKAVLELLAVATVRAGAPRALVIGEPPAVELPVYRLRSVADE